MWWIQSKLSEIESQWQPPAMCMKLDKHKASILIDTGFRHSGQQAKKNKWDTSCWSIVISFGTPKISASEMIINNETNHRAVESREPFSSLPSQVCLLSFHSVLIINSLAICLFIFLTWGIKKCSVKYNIPILQHTAHPNIHSTDLVLVSSKSPKP